MAKFESFIFGDLNVPVWFNDEAKMGRVKINYDDEGNIVNAKIMSGTKVYEAQKGDSIMKSISGLVVIPKDKAKKYGVQKNVKSNEESKEEENNN